MITIRRSYKTNKSKDEIFALLTTLNEYSKVHPLIIDCINTERENEFVINERPFSFLPFTISYIVKVVLQHSKIIYLIDNVPFNDVKIEYKLDGIERTQKIEFKLMIKGIFPINRLLSYKMINAQNQLMKRFDQMR